MHGWTVKPRFKAHHHDDAQTHESRCVLWRTCLPAAMTGTRLQGRAETGSPAASSQPEAGQPRASQAAVPVRAPLTVLPGASWLARSSRVMPALLAYRRFPHCRQRWAEAVRWELLGGRAAAGWQGCASHCRGCTACRNQREATLLNT